MSLPPPAAHALGEVETALRKRQPSDDLPKTQDWTLVVYAGANLGRVFPLTHGKNTLGRSTQASITLLDEEVSRVHACLSLTTNDRGTTLTLEDLGSTNGTFVNGIEIDRSQKIKAGDRIALGTHVLKCVCMDALERSFHEMMLDQSTRDPLTGLGNRGATLQEFQNRFELSARHQRPLSVIMCDLDHFKDVNDVHGHGAGDLVLTAFGERVKQNLRGTDLAGRIGGEEFLLVLPETDLAGALLLAERLRQAVHENAVCVPAGSLHVTCSMGVAERDAGDQDAGALLGRADGALYQAKWQGRDRVVPPAPPTL